MKILIINRVNSSNLGDQFIGRSLKEAVSELGHEVIVSDLSGSQQTAQIKEVPYKHFKNRRRFKIMKTVKWALSHHTLANNVYDYASIDCVIIGGGELLQDNNAFPFALYKWVKAIKEVNPSCHIYLFGVGVTNSFSLISKFFITKAVSKIDGAYTRDAKSRKNLKDIFDIDSIEMPDVTFLFKTIENTNQKEGALLGITSYYRVKYYGAFDSENQYFEKMYKIADNLCKKYENITCIYSDNDDNAACHEFVKWCNKNKGVLYNVASYKDLDGFIRLIDKSLFIESPRMHACILGMLLGCDIKPIIISEKMKSFSGKYLSNEKEIIIETCKEQARKHLLEIIDDKCNKE